jgi:hypothetical protein
MEPRKHLWLPVMAAAVLAAGLAMPAASAFNPQPDPPGKLRAGQKTIGNPEIRKNRRVIGDSNTRKNRGAVGDPNQVGDPGLRAIGDPDIRWRKGPPTPGPR